MEAPLRPLLRDVAPHVRQETIMALGALKATGMTAALCASLQDPDAGVCATAATVLGQLDDRNAVIPLLAALTDRDWAVRYRTVISLGVLQDSRAVDALLALLRSPGPGSVIRAYDYNITERAAQSLAAIGDARAIPPLIAALECGSLANRATAAQALGELHARAAVSALIEELDHFGYDVGVDSGVWDALPTKVNACQIAANALQAITGKNFGMDAATWRAWAKGL
jgi:HEAT repeat protein